MFALVFELWYYRTLYDNVYNLWIISENFFKNLLNEWIQLIIIFFNQRVFTLPDKAHGNGPLLLSWQKPQGNCIATTGYAGFC